jgi:ubiquitin-protein ligase
MNPKQIERRKNDYLRLQELCAQSGGRIAIKSLTGTPPTSYVVEFTGRMLGPTGAGPHGVRRTARFSITLPPNYPDAGGDPVVMSIDPIWHPHFFESGRFCVPKVGDEVLPFLDTFVTLIWQALVLDPRVNSGSAANSAAKSWQTANAKRLPLDTPDVRMPAGSVPDLIPVQAVSVSAPAPAVASPRIQFRDPGDPSPSVTRAPVPVTARISWR